MNELNKILKEQFNDRFKLVSQKFDKETFVPTYTIKDNTDNLRYELKQEIVTYGYAFIISELTKILVDKREGKINYILNDNNNSSGRGE